MTVHPIIQIFPSLVLTVTALVGWAPVALAMNISLGGGLTRIIKNDLLATEGGDGTSGTLHLSFAPGDQTYVSLGLAATAVSYEISSNQQEELNEPKTVIEKSGRFSGATLAPQILVDGTLGWFRPYSRFGYLVGLYDYRADSESRFTYSGSSMKTSQKIAITLKSRGLFVGIGLKTKGPLGYYLEYREDRETHRIATLNFDIENTVDDKKAPLNSASAGLGDDLEELEGERFGHATRSIYLGVFWEP